MVWLACLSLIRRGRRATEHEEPEEGVAAVHVHVAVGCGDLYIVNVHVHVAVGCGGHWQYMCVFMASSCLV